MTNKTKPAPPTGPITIKGVLVQREDNKNITGYFVDQGDTGHRDIFGADLRVTVLTKDTYDGEIIRLDDVPVKVSGSSVVTGLSEDQEVMVHIPSYTDYKHRRVETMYVTPAEDNQVVQNSSLPTQVATKYNLGAFSEQNSPACKRYHESQRTAYEQLGILVDRDDVTVYQGKRSGRSPGMLVRQDNGELFFFDNATGKYAKMSGGVTEIRANAVDLGDTPTHRNTLAYGGLPAIDNEALYVLPAGTVLTPQARTLGNLPKILNTILLVTDMIDLSLSCYRAISDIIKGRDGSRGIDQARESSFPTLGTDE